MRKFIGILKYEKAISEISKCENAFVKHQKLHNSKFCETPKVKIL